MAPCFHLAFPVADLSLTRQFYGEGLGCALGRETPSALILNLYGHQLVAHLTRTPLTPQVGIYPRHFGLVFDQEADWEALVERSQRQGLPFYQVPKRRFAGDITEHRTVFLADPFHNLLEFKYYLNPEAIFGAQSFTQVGEGSTVTPGFAPGGPT